MAKPALFGALRGASPRQLANDALAGLVVSVVAVPLAVAFALASGVGPEAGLYTAIVAGFLISALGGSRVQIGGPTGAFVVIVYEIVQRHGVEGLAIATFMAGAILVVMGLARLGAAIKFIPFPVTTGFTSGIAVVILSGQIRDALGLRMGDVPAAFVDKWGAYGHALPTLSPAAAGLTVATVAVLALWPRVTRAVPGPFAALVLLTGAAHLLHLPVETVGSRYGALPVGLPRPSLPHVDLAGVGALVGPALTIALLAAVESLLSAVVADGMTGYRHDSNAELVAQGVANLASPLFGGIPATGAVARTVTNIRSGGRTPVAGMVHAVSLLLITLFFGRWVALIPLPVLAGILVMVAWHMGDWRTFASELSAPKSDVAVLATTFLLTVFIDLTVAIEVGMVLAAFLFMRRMAEVTDVSRVEGGAGGAGGAGAALPETPPDVLVYRIRGSFFFGAAEKFRDTLHQVQRPPRVLVLAMRDVLAMDSTGLHALRDMVRRSRAEGTTVLLAGVHAQPLAAMARSGLLDELGDDALHGTVEEAVAAAAAGEGVNPAPPPPRSPAGTPG